MSESLRRKWFRCKYEHNYDLRCSCCMKKTAHIKYIEDGPGFVCRHCYISGPRCSVKGCNEPACKDGGGKCRDHWLGKYQIDFRRLHSTGRSAIAMAQDNAWRWTDE